MALNQIDNNRKAKENFFVRFAKALKLYCFKDHDEFEKKKKLKEPRKGFIGKIQHRFHFIIEAFIYSSIYN